MTSRRSLGWREWLGFSRPSDRFSLEELERQHNELVRQTRIHKTRRNRLDQPDTRPASGGNKQTFIETLRSIAELMIWGDQHEPRFFDFFLEKNVLSEFYEILSSSENRQGDVATQVLQTLSIMIQNIKNETSIFYLFSNNHLNNILQLDFDFSDEEVLAFYISFLKSISLKLNPRTVHFFFQQAEEGTPASFPLYSEAIRFVGNKEPMVRAAVRTLTLNVYSVKVDAVQEFLVSKPASNYFTELALHAAEQCQALDRLLLEAENTIADSYGALDSQMTRIEDLLSYFNDIFLSGSDVMSIKLASCLWEHFVGTALLWPLLEVGSRPCLSSSYGISGTGVFRAVSALCVIERIFNLLENSVLCEAIACCLLAGDNCFSTVCERVTKGVHALRPTAPFLSLTTPLDIQEDGSSTDLDVISRAGKEANSLKSLFIKYRESFLRCLSGDSAQIGTAAVRVLVSLMLHPRLDPEVLDVCGVLPLRTRIRRNLIQELTGEDPGSSSSKSTTPASSFRNSAPSPEVAPEQSPSQSPAQGQEEQPEPLRRRRSPIHFIKNLARGSRASIEVPPEEEPVEEDPPPEVKISKSDELMKALIQLTLLPTLPPLTISYITWIISQLTATNNAFTPTQMEIDMRWSSAVEVQSCISSVNTALIVCQASVADELRGVWCDALVFLVQQEWRKIRQNATDPSLICTSTVLLDSVFAQRASELGSALYSSQGSVTSQQLAVRLRLGFSAQVALHVYFKIRRLIALTQLKQYLSDGEISISDSLPSVSITETHSSEVKEGHVLPMKGTTPIPCTVAFVQGQEMSAYYFVHGLPERVFNDDNSDSDSMGGIPEVARSSPFIVLTTPVLNRLNMGSVLSAAPLMGSEPRVDQQHENWLYLRVRPGISRFVDACIEAGRWNQPPWATFRSLRDGHWVLAFHNPGEALSAKYMTQEFIAKLSTLYCKAMSPLLTRETENGHL